MNKVTRRAIAGCAAAAFAFAGQAAWAASASPEEQLLESAKAGASAKLGPVLGNLYDEYGGARDKSKFASRNPLVALHGDSVAVDLYADDAVALRRTLASLGATRISAKGPLMSAHVPVRALGDLAAAPSLRFARPAIAVARAASQGSVVSQGDVSQRTDRVRAATGLDGAGVTVGVLSDSYECNPGPFVPGAPTSTAAQDVVSGDAPPEGVDVLDNGACPGTDEGRGMTQLVHDVAPGAALKFHSAFNGLVDFAIGILELRDAGADVIVDDVIYYNENMYSDGIIAQAVDLAVQDGAAYFSSAGNDARSSYESRFREVAVPTNGSGNLTGAGTPFALAAHDFDAGAGTDTLQHVRITPDGGQAVVVFSLQWDQPFLSSTTFAQLVQPNGQAPKAATGDLDLLIYDSKGILVRRCPPGVATGITCQLTGERNVGGDAVDFAAIVVTGPKNKSADFYLRIVRTAGEAPRWVKYVASARAGTFEFVEHAADSRAGTVFGHANAALAEAVGASSWYLTEEFDSYFSTLVADAPGACVPACLNDFSSAGGVRIFLDRYGNRLAAPVTRDKPGVTGPDGGNTTFFFADSSFDDDDGDGRNSPTSTFITPVLDDPADEKPNFFGTSASAPHVAGIAALMRQKNASLAPEEIYAILRSTAQDVRKREVTVVPGPGDSVFSPLPAGFDDDSGFGFVDAEAALAATPAP